jgi:hypothetical protein
VQRGSLPVKVIRTSKLALPSEAAEQVALGEEGEEGATSALFGRWQTDAWRPPPARNGTVPRVRNHCSRLFRVERFCVIVRVVSGPKTK